MAIGVTKDRLWVVQLLLVVVVAVWVAGCKSDRAVEPPTSQEHLVYRAVVRKVLPAASAKVIAAVKQAIDTAKLDLVSESTTNIDALFHVQSALRKEFKIEIEAVTHQQTRVEISIMDLADTGLAKILFDRIVGNL